MGTCSPKLSSMKSPWVGLGIGFHEPAELTISGTIETSQPLKLYRNVNQLISELCNLESLLCVQGVGGVCWC